jgi:hypothetical protein
MKTCLQPRTRVPYEMSRAFGSVELADSVVPDTSAYMWDFPDTTGTVPQKPANAGALATSARECGKGEKSSMQSTSAYTHDFWTIHLSMTSIRIPMVP